MLKIRLNRRRLSHWLLIIVPIALIISYFYLKVDDYARSENEIAFIQPKDTGVERQEKTTYHRKSSRIYMKSISNNVNYVDFGSSMCYINGTDLISMERSENVNWKCSCLRGWHGKDCGQPEIIWRAFMTYRSPLKAMELRRYERKLIYIFKVDKYSQTTAEIRVNELGSIVDLFILCEDSTEDLLERKLNNDFLKDYQHKILYLKVKATLKTLWSSIMSTVKNLNDDDLVLITNSNEIPNKYALDFLKKYDKWPEPIRFRLRWSVFGYFWLHPSKTVISGGACSIAFLKENLNANLDQLNDNKTLALHKGIILGDLNHFGGWYCEYCLESHEIVEFLQLNPRSEVNLDEIKAIDTTFIEDLIENGLYIDGKTELKRARRYQDKYFAPYHVLEQNWHYDPLLINFYTKLDYYEE